MPISDSQDEGGYAVPGAALGERVERLVEVLLVVHPNPLVQLSGVDLDGGQLARLPLDLVDSLCIAHHLDHADLVAGRQGCVRSHPEVEALHVPNVVHHRDN